MAEAKGQAAWGVEIGEAEARLVRVVRSGDELVTERFEAKPIPTDADGEPNVAAALAALPAPPADEPVWVALPDDAVLYRRLVLPAAEEATLAQLVASQAEVALPLPPEEMAWGWGALPPTAEGAPVLIAAAQQSLTQRLRAAAPWMSRAQFLPQASALAAATRSAEPRWLVHDRATSITLALVGAEGLLAARVGHDRRELGAAARQLLDEAGLSRVAVNDAVVMSESAEAEGELARWLGVDAAPAALPRGWRVQADAEVERVLVAAGAAAHAFDPPRPSLILDDGAAPLADAGRAGPSRRTLIAAAVIVLAVVAWWGLDLWEASRREAAVQALRAETSAAGGTSRALAVGEFLERRPTPPLLVIEALSNAASDRVQLRELHYDAPSGQIRINGTVQGVNELDKTLMNLKVAAPLNDVQMRSANIERDTWSFDLEARLVPLHRFLALDGTRRPSSDTPRADGEPPPDPRLRRAAGPPPAPDTEGATR